MNVSAVIVTRGNVDLEPILAAYASAGLYQVVVWDNAREDDLGVYGRYAALARCMSDTVIVQDDDCVLAPATIAELIAGHEPGVLVANMPEPFRAHYSDSCLVGFGAIFDRDLPDTAFRRFSSHVPLNTLADGLFGRACDVIFTTLTPFKLLDLPYTNLPWATGPDRMYRQHDHVGERARVLDLARMVRDL